MQRITITLDDALLEELDALVALRGYPNRSKAMRDLARAGIQQLLLEASAAPDCLAALIYVQQPQLRDASQRLSKLFHAHHDLSVARLQIPLGHDSGLDIAVLKGDTGAVTALAEAVLAEKGVAHGRTVILPAVMDDDEHDHGGDGAHTHTHIRAR